MRGYAGLSSRPHAICGAKLADARNSASNPAYGSAVGRFTALDRRSAESSSTSLYNTRLDIPYQVEHCSLASLK